MTSLKTSIKTITYLSDTGCLEIQGASLGSMTLGGVINPVQDLAASLQLAFDSGAKRVLLPMSSAMDIPTVPAELFTKFQVSFYSDPVDAVYKALGVN
ncbi:hypothetical protein QMY48_02993 [Escherichia coli]|nr:hypothetical protein QMY48_02993 [Escherichia coli]